MTVRNIRAYQAASLVPQPRRAGRTAVYGDEHLTRLVRIRTLRALGLGLEAIRAALDGMAPGGAPMSDLARRVLEEAASKVRPTILPAAEFERRWGPVGSEIRERLVGLGVYRELPGGDFEVSIPAIQDLGGILSRYGVSITSMMDAQEALEAPLQMAAATVADYYLREVVPKLLAASQDDPDGAADAVARILPLAAEIGSALYQSALRRAFADIGKA